MGIFRSFFISRLKPRKEIYITKTFHPYCRNFKTNNHTINFFSYV